MQFKRWNINPNGFSSMRDFNLRVGFIEHYDDPVDRSQFRPDSEQVRAFRLTGSGSNLSPLYDKEDSPPSDLEVQLRSGKFDKAEVSQILQIKSKNVKEDLKKIQSEYLVQTSDSKGSNQEETV